MCSNFTADVVLSVCNPYKPSVHFLKPQNGYCQYLVVVLILPLLFILFVCFKTIYFICVFF